MKVTVGDSVKKIMEKIIKDGGFDGLYNVNDDCGCNANNLMPCDGMINDCMVGHKIMCCCGDHDYHIGIRVE